jgi:type IV secretory pathway TraG/TraD family ATPase VirD4
MSAFRKFSQFLTQSANLVEKLGQQWEQPLRAFNATAPPPGRQLAAGIDLDNPLLMFGSGDVVRISVLFEGVFITGATGSGKSSAPGALLAQQKLSVRLWDGKKIGFLILCAKPDECSTWKKYASRTGRENDLIILEAGGDHAYNFFEEEAKANPDTENLIAMFLEVLSITQEKKQSNDSFWMDATKELMRNGIDLLKASKEKMTLNALCSIIDDAPLSIADADAKEWRENSHCYQAIEKAGAYFAGVKKRLSQLSNKEREQFQSEERDFKAAHCYFLSKFPSMDERPRSGVVMMWNGLVDMFRRGTMADLFCGKTSFHLSDLEQGKILILNLPVLGKSKETGRIAQILMKYLFQRHIQARDVSLSPCPVVVWADEAHYFVSENDVKFATTARSSRTITVYISQTIRNFQEVLGQKGEISADALLAGFQTKIFCCNGDNFSNKWASELIGQTWQLKTSTNAGRNDHNLNPGEGSSEGSSTQEQLCSQIDPIRFTQLRKGSAINQFFVDCIVFQPGKRWMNGKNHIEIALNQKRINGE